jgi:hypothetical protein
LIEEDGMRSMPCTIGTIVGPITWLLDYRFSFSQQEPQVCRHVL